MIKFLTIARVLYDKGFSELASCAAYSIKMGYNVEFQWLGDIDEDYSQFVSREVIMDLHNKNIINYLGFQKDVRKYIKDADCIILPSYHEGMSRVLMESLAMNKPIITTDIPGCREMVIDGKNGFLCIPKDKQSLIDAVEKFINLSNDERNKMGKHSRQYAESRFDIKNVIKVYDDIVASLVNM